MHKAQMVMRLTYGKADRQEVQAALRELARVTGGEFIFNANPVYNRELDADDLEVWVSTRTYETHYRANGDICYGCKDMIPEGRGSQREVEIDGQEHGTLPFCEECFQLSDEDEEEAQYLLADFELEQAMQHAADRGDVTEHDRLQALYLNPKRGQ
jgi:hypothetical protein